MFLSKLVQNGGVALCRDFIALAPALRQAIVTKDESADATTHSHHSSGERHTQRVPAHRDPQRSLKKPTTSNSHQRPLPTMQFRFC